MTLLITVLAAVASTAVWYCCDKARKLKVGALCWMFWGASLMWLGDAIFEYAELHEKYFTPELSDMINDGYLGLSVVALALVIWTVIVLVKDPMNVVRNSLKKKA